MNEDGVRDFVSSIAKPSDVVPLDAERFTQEPPISPQPCPPVPAPQLDEARMVIFPYVRDIARELHDESSLTATTTRAVNIFHRSGIDIHQFQNHLLSARQRTQERTASIKKARADGVKVKVPYLFAVLEKSLGLVESSQSSHSPSLPYPVSPSKMAYSPAYQTNPSLQDTSGFWNRRE